MLSSSPQLFCKTCKLATCPDTSVWRALLSVHSVYNIVKGYPRWAFSWINVCSNGFYFELILSQNACGPQREGLRTRRAKNVNLGFWWFREGPGSRFFESRRPKMQDCLKKLINYELKFLECYFLRGTKLRAFYFWKFEKNLKIFDKFWEIVGK